MIGEGRYSAPWQARAAMWIGADAVTLGGSLNDPVKQTILYSRALAKPDQNVGAVDLGGSWLRFAVFSPGLELLSLEKVTRPPSTLTSGCGRRHTWWIDSVSQRVSCPESGFSEPTKLGCCGRKRRSGGVAS